MADVVELDDLLTPRLTPAQQQILEHTDARVVDLSLDNLFDTAVAKTGLDEFGPGEFTDRLSAHVAAIVADDGQRPLNRITLRSRVIRLLGSRLLLTDLLKRYPEIHDIEIERPFIVVGLPRSGTTHLVNLIAADPRRRALPYWESQEPFARRGEGPDASGVDPRYARSAAEHQMVTQSVTPVKAMHDRYPEAIEEEVELLDLDFASYTLEWHARVPDWRDYYLTLDQNVHYRYLKTVLKALTFLRGPRTWVLKSPQHCEQLGPLMATFPDATVAFTHRDPVAVIQSAITMLAYGDRMRRWKVEPQWLVDYWTDRVERLLRACVRDRDLVPPERSLDISFHHLNGNEMAQLDELYARAGVALTPQTRSQFQAFLGSNPRGKHGRIRYNLTKHFQRTPDDIRDRFGFYFDRFDVRPEDI